LGEISPDEFGEFIGENIRLQPVLLGKEGHLAKLLEFYMGKNTPDRQDFIIDNLRIELDKVEAKEVVEETEVSL
jgi:topoisomerase-4 subunit B